jgi:hypothetical protein
VAPRLPMCFGARGGAFPRCVDRCQRQKYARGEARDTGACGFRLAERDWHYPLELPGRLRVSLSLAGVHDRSDSGLCVDDSCPG